AVRYEGQASLMTPAGNLPLSFELEVDNLADAIAQFPDAVNAAAERTIEELKELQRHRASRSRCRARVVSAAPVAAVAFSSDARRTVTNLFRLRAADYRIQPGTEI